MKDFEQGTMFGGWEKVSRKSLIKNATNESKTKMCRVCGTSVSGSSTKCSNELCLSDQLINK